MTTRRSQRQTTNPAEPLAGLPLARATPPHWVRVASADIDALLVDHAHCELKAAANALAMAGRFAMRTDLVRDMTALAREELRHFEQVHALVRARGRTLTRPTTDHYVKLLHERTRRGGSADTVLLDQLVRCGFIEARSCERFRLLTQAALPATLCDFYGELAIAEARHHQLFFAHAARAVGTAKADARIAEIAAVEAEIIASLPLGARIH